VTDTHAAPGAPEPPLGETIALAMTLGFATFIPLLALVKVLTTPVYLAALKYSENQHSETALYLLSFAVLLPAAVVLAPRLASWLESRLGARRGSACRALLAGGFLGAILAARVLPGGGGIVAVLVADGVWALVAIVAVRWAIGREAPPGRGSSGLGWAAVGVAAVVTLLVVTSPASISPIGLAVATMAVVGAALAPIPKLSRRWGFAADVAVVIALALTIPDLVVFSPAGPGLSTSAAFTTRIIQFHQDFFLGPANVVVHGGAVLVDTASQYGVGSIYQIAPLGYGPLVVLDALLYVLYFATGYLILRFAGTSRGLAFVALVVAVIVLIYNLVYPVGALLQHGPLRFGIPMIVILAAVLEARHPRRRRALLAVQCLAVGLASIWALEAFAATTATFLALRAFAAWAGDRPALRAAGRDLALALAACVAFQAMLALATLVFRGHLPEWGDYFAFLREFLTGSIGQITYDFPPWSPGLAVGGACFGSAAAFLILVRRRPALVLAQRPLATALCGTSAFGIFLFYYFVDRSASHILPYVSFPVVLAGTLWISLLAATAGAAARVTRWALAMGAATAVFVTSVAWSSVGTRFSHSPLGELLPGGGSLGAAVSDLWHLAPLQPQTAHGEALLSRYTPGDGPVAMVLNSDLQEEILLRSGRVDSIPFGDPVEDSFAGTRFLADLGRGVDALAPGTRVLISPSGLQALRRLRADPARDPVAQPILTADGLVGVQEWVLKRIAEDFRLRVIHRDSAYIVLELGGRRAST